jgi:hypothetical protein
MPATFEVTAALMRHYARELGAGNHPAITVAALCRSDAGRVKFWDGELIVPSAKLERLWSVDFEEKICVEAAERYPYLSACVGYAAERDRDEPQPAAWLVETRTGDVIDVARRHRRAIGFYGVQLRATEVANWTEHQPHLAAERNVHRLSV